MIEFSKKYHELLTTDYAGINLTRILKYEEFYEKQILDSIKAWQDNHLLIEKASEVSTFVDIGFGGGFPILPLAFLYPEKKFIGFEARNKKVVVVNEIAKKLGAENVQMFSSAD